MGRKKATEPKPKCKLWFCRKESWIGGLCVNHYRNMQRHGFIQLRGDAQALYGYAVKSHVVFSNIINRCWKTLPLDLTKECRYCGHVYPGHYFSCVVVSVSGLMDGVPLGGRMGETHSGGSQ